MQGIRSGIRICLLLCAGLDLPASERGSVGEGATLDPPEFRPWRPAAARFADDDRPYWSRNLFKRFLTDQRFLATTWWPAESRRFGFSVPLLASVALASGSNDGGGADARWQQSLEHWTEQGGRDFAHGVTRLGDAETAIVLLGGTYLASRWAGNERGMRVASLSSEALLSAGLYSTVLKGVAARTRPTSDDAGRFFVRRPGDNQQPTSYPSGHAMGAFAVASVLSWEFRDSRWVPWTAYGTATLVALSRVGLGRHYPSDVLAGAIIGQSIGRMVVERAGGSTERRAWQRLQPMVEPHNGGIGIAYHHAW